MSDIELEHEISINVGNTTIAFTGTTLNGPFDSDNKDHREYLVAALVEWGRSYSGLDITVH